MFKIDKSPAYWWPVEVLSAKAGAENAGEVERQKFEVEFRRLDEAAIDKIGRDLADEATQGGGGNIAWCKRVVLSFRGVEDDGVALSPTPDNIDMLLHITGVAQAVVAAFFASRAPSLKKKSGS